MKLRNRLVALVFAAVLMLAFTASVYAESPAGDVTGSDAVSDTDKNAVGGTLPETAPTAAPDEDKTEEAQDESLSVESDTDISGTDETGEEDEKEDNYAEISDTLQIMGKGMLGIFIVMGIILILILVLNAATKPRRNKQ